MSGGSPFKIGPKDDLSTLLKYNAEWAQETAKTGVFEHNAKGQSPTILWIGCADSRIAESCLGVNPGEVFVHRNIANTVLHSDMSVLSVLQLAVDGLKVRKIIVCGHTNCKGVNVALSETRLGGELDGWLRNLRDVRAKHAKELSAIADEEKREERLVELNVAEQVRRVRRNDRVLAAQRERELEVHGLVYDVSTGLLREVEVPAEENEESYVVA